MAYAKRTKVSVGKTKEELERMLTKAGASGYAYAQRGAVAFVAFQIKNIGIKINITLPHPPSQNATKVSIATYDQLCKAKWRCLLLVVKAKLESIESGIETLEEAFLSQIVLTNGDCVGQRIIPKLEQLNEASPALLLGI